MIKFCYFLILVIYFTFLSCHFGPNTNDTRISPREFLNEHEINKTLCSRDKDSILTQLNYFLHTHSKSFYKKEYFDSTIANIDTILYSPDQNRVAVFSYSKTPTSRQLIPDLKYSYFYDAECYLGKRQKDSFDLKCLTRYRLVNFNDQQEVTYLLRKFYFTIFATLKDGDNTYTYDVNFDDKRFWNCMVWQEYFED